MVLGCVSGGKNNLRGVSKYLITFDVRKVHGLGNELGDCALATASWTGDEPNVVVLGIGLVVLDGLAIRKRCAIGETGGSG